LPEKYTIPVISVINVEYEPLNVINDIQNPEIVLITKTFTNERRLIEEDIFSTP